MRQIDRDVVQRAVEILRGGGLVAYPTDTVYGLAALPANDEAVARLFEAKRRDPNQPTPLLIDDAGRVETLVADVPQSARLLMAAFWPGALTIVLTTSSSFHSNAVGKTVGLRVPDHPLPRELCRLLDSPITGTSANVADGPEPLSADDVCEQLGDAVDLVIAEERNEGRRPGDRPSTVVDCTVSPPRILRHGAIEEADVLRVLETGDSEAG